MQTLISILLRGCNVVRALGLTVRGFLFLSLTSYKKFSLYACMELFLFTLPLLTNISPDHLLPSPLGYTSITDDQLKHHLIQRIFHNPLTQNFETSLF